MNAIAWTFTPVLAVAFFGAAAVKTLLRKSALREDGLLWVDDFICDGMKTSTPFRPSS